MSNNMNHNEFKGEIELLKQAARDLEPTQQQKKRILNRLKETVRVTKPVPARTPKRSPRRMRRFAYGFIALFLAVWLGGAGVVQAAQNSIPGDTLYPVKRGWERAELALAADPGKRAALHISHARNRLLEAERTEQDDRLLDDTVNSAINAEDLLYEKSPALAAYTYSFLTDTTMLNKQVLASAALGALLVAGPVAAQDDGLLVDPGLTPDSPFYFLDTLGEQLGLTFTFSAEAKANKNLQFAEEKLAEAEALAESTPQSAGIEKALSRYEGYLSDLQDRVEQAAAADGEDVQVRVAEATSRHLTVLDELVPTLPEQAQEAVVRARTQSERGHNAALEGLAQRDAARAAGVSAGSAAKNLDRAANAPENEEAEKAVDRFVDDVEHAKDAVDTARATGQDARAVQELVNDSLANSEEALNRVLERVPDQAKDAIRKAMERSSVDVEIPETPAGVNEADEAAADRSGDAADSQVDALEEADTEAPDTPDTDVEEADTSPEVSVPSRP